MFPSIALRACLLAALLVSGGFAATGNAGLLDSIGQPRSDCDPTKASCAPGMAPAPCRVDACLGTPEEQAAFEKKNNCKFPPSACGDFDKATQCCGKDPRTGKPKVVEKVMTKEKPRLIGDTESFWATYTKMCPDKKQNIAPPNELWQKCEKGKIHMGGSYEVTEIVKNGTARDYCIDGCSIPSVVVLAAKAVGIFLVADRNNPSGYKDTKGSKPASFYPGCRAHDICYQTCKDDQATCDNRIKEAHIAACGKIPAGHKTSRPKITPPFFIAYVTRDKCREAANEMFEKLRDFGESAFNLRRQQYCQCC